MKPALYQQYGTYYFGILIRDENIDIINFINLLGKWYINITILTSKLFLNIVKNTIDLIVYNQNINNINPKDWEIKLMIML